MSFNKGDRIGPFAIERQLSEDGGMSRVFLAHDSNQTNYKAAVKITLMDGENNAVFQDILRRETTFLTDLRHPGIVRIFPLKIGNHVAFTARALAHEDKPWYYAMEYLACGGLDGHAKEIARRFPLLWGIELFYQIVCTIHFMHQRGLAHCDLKPQNVMFRTPPTVSQTPTPVLIDFGSVSSVRQLHQLTLSIRYSAPEVLLAHDRHDLSLSHLRADKIDIWGLGLLLYEIVTGQPLFDQKRKSAIKTTILRGSIKPMSQQRQNVDESLDFLLHKMLEKHPSRRPTTDQVIEALEERITSVLPPRIGG